MWCIIEDLSQVVPVLQLQEHVGAHMENPEGDHDPLDMLEGGLEDETDDEKIKTTFTMLDP